jgi:hypothetical protein
VNDVLAEPDYLQPYLTAARRHGCGFGSLLWASPATQAARFDAFARLCELDGHSVLDAGCGRADLLDFLLARGVHPDHYTGLEAVAALADAAETKRRPHSLIVRADFVAEPARLFTGADVMIFSGSLNTLQPQSFYEVLRTAWQAAVHELAFNFLASPQLAAIDYLHWHRPFDVMEFARELGGEVEMLDDYLPGDCTIRIRKPAEPAAESAPQSTKDAPL